MISVQGIAFMFTTVILVVLILLINKYSKFYFRTTISLIGVVICSYGIIFLSLYLYNDKNTIFPSGVLNYNKIEVLKYDEISSGIYFEAIITYDDGDTYQCIGVIDKEKKYRKREISIYISDVNGEFIYTLSGDYHKHKDFFNKLIGENFKTIK